MENRKYLNIVAHYESCLEEHGDHHLGVDWPNAEDADTRYQVMLDVIKDDGPESVRLLDFGCGASHLYEYIRRCGRHDIVYAGLDLSPKFVALSRAKFPRTIYYCRDLLTDPAAVPDFDYVVMNGVFTEKCSLSYEEMLAYFEAMLVEVFQKARIGIAFNVMSKHVDWERDDLFHLPLDTLAGFLFKQLSRRFLIRNDYGLYEYTTYVYR